MISYLAGLTLAFAFSLVLVPSSSIDCRDPDYLNQLKDQVRSFYVFYPEPSVTGLSPQGPCTTREGNQIARPRWPVATLQSWQPQRSTCPWYTHIDEDINGLRFPCRISKAKPIGTDMFTSNGNNFQTCQRHPQSKYDRHHGKICSPFVQVIPIVVSTGCRNGINDYAVSNMTINVGFTCIFEQNQISQ